MFSEPILLGNRIYAQTGFESQHPMAMPKTAPVLALIRSLDWFRPETYVESPDIVPRRLMKFHSHEYVCAAFDAETSQCVTPDIRSKFGLGIVDTPIFPHVIRRAAVACGAALKAADLLKEHAVVFSPLGGAHDAEPGRASGFGYFNDLVLGILALKETGHERIAYIDLDAHHGNAVEDAFAFDRTVLTLSIHQENCWPYSGVDSDMENGVINIPVPAGFNDTEMEFLLRKVVTPQLERFAPTVVVVQAGADSLEADRMMDLGLSNRAYFNAIDVIRNGAPRIWVTGGGGYNPWAVTPCWTGIWCVLNNRDPAKQRLVGLDKIIIDLISKWPSVSDPPEGWLQSLVDDPRPGPVRDILQARVRALA